MPPPSLPSSVGTGVMINKLCMCARARVWTGGGAPGRKKEGSIRGSPTPSGRSLCDGGGIQGNRLTSVDLRVRVRGYVRMCTNAPLKCDEGDVMSPQKVSRYRRPENPEDRRVRDADGGGSAPP